MKRIVDLPVQAGIYTEQTARGATGQWKDGDKVRFRYGLVEKIGGWARVAGGTFIGLARRLWDWRSLDTRSWVSLGTESKLYLYQGGVYYDITPLRRSQVRTDPISTTISSDIVTITDAAHGAQVGDFVNISGANPVGGIIVGGEYQILSIIDIDNYTIQDDQTATATATGGGTVQLDYDISVGLTNTSFGRGWGTGTWSQETWSTPRTISTTIELLRTWSLDNWGEDLLAVPRGGGLYWWDRNTGPTARATRLVGSPQNINYMIISQRNRHVFALGCTDEFTGRFDPLLIRWCSQEDFNDWIPTSTNTSGDLRLFRGSQIVAATRTRGEILIWTDVSVHQINYLGGSAVFGIQTVGENVSILSPNAAVEVDYRVFFMAEADFYVYDGVLRVLPCTVRNRVYDNLTVGQKEKAFAGLNREFNEIWFFFPGKDPDIWFEDNFATSALSGSYAVQSMANSDKYSVAFNAGGYTEASRITASNVYDYVYIAGVAPQARVETALDWDLEATFELAAGATPIWTGPVIHVTDISGNENTEGDNLSGYFAEIDLQTNFGRISKRRPTGQPSTLVQLNLNTLPTPVTLQAGITYGVTITRTATQILATIFDPVTDTKQQYAAHTLDAQDLIDFTSAGYAFSFADESSPATNDPGQKSLLKSMRAAAGGVLTATQGIGASTEVNQYVIYNYEEETWATGTLARTAWADRSPAFEKPYAADTNRLLQQHETGTDDDGAAIEAFIETYDMEIPEAGEYLMHVDQLIPDFVRLEGQVDLKLNAKKYPQVPQYQEKGPYPVTANTPRISVRIRGRQVSLRMESTQIGDAWRMGTMRARVFPHGKRA